MHLINVRWTHPVVSCGVILHYGPGLSIITESNFESCNKLNGAEVFCPLRDDSCNLLRRQQVHLKNTRQVHVTE